MACWLGGSWGVDVLTGRPELEHRDIDIDFDEDGSITQTDPNGRNYTFQKEWFTSTEHKGPWIPYISVEAQPVS